jgi:hypothetical protein
MMFKSKQRIAIAAAVIAAGVPSTASAMVNLEPGTASDPIVPIGAPPAAPVAQSSFQWDDAGIGAASVLALLAAGGATSAAARRRRLTVQG